MRGNKHQIGNQNIQRQPIKNIVDKLLPYSKQLRECQSKSPDIGLISKKQKDTLVNKVHTPTKRTNQAVEQQLAKTVEKLCKDTQLVGVYFMDITKNSLKREDVKEQRVTINPSHLTDPKVRLKRSENISTLIAICEATETEKSLFCAVYLFDKYLQALGKSKTSAQILYMMSDVMVSTLFTSMKLCEIYPPDIHDLLELVADPAFIPADVFKIQSNLLQLLNFDVNRDHETHFIDIFGKLLDFSNSQIVDCKAMLQYGLIANETLHMKPSLKAAGAAYLMLCSYDVERYTKRYTDILVTVSRYSVRELRMAGKALLNSMWYCQIEGFTTVKQKYMRRYNIPHLVWIVKVGGKLA